MSGNYDNLSNVRQGRTDWRVKVRVIREWRGKTIGGELYKGYNLVLLDAKNIRIQAYVPQFLIGKLQKKFQVGKMYTITNFQVKDYTELDKWRPVTIDRQIQFTNLTRVKEMDETEYFIPQNCFEFHDLSQLNSFVLQSTYLIDVVGIVIQRSELQLKRNRNGQDQYQVRMRITDGRNQLNVTLWDHVAESFQADISTNRYEEPLILITAAGKMGTFRDELDLCNFSPTAYYINYNHHSVVQLRKLSCQPDFKLEQHEIMRRKKEAKLLTVQEIKKLGDDYIEEDVICQVYITSAEETDPWFYLECTTCYKQVDLDDGNYICKNCNNRIVPNPNKKFGILILGKDKTGDIDILLMDRPVRKLFGMTASDMQDKYKGKFPSEFKTMEKEEYTVKIEIREFNITDNNDVYIGTDIYQGFYLEDAMLPDYTQQQPTEFSLGQSSGTSVHLDNISHN